MQRILLFLSLVLLISCSARETETVAHITQRRHEPGGKLMISYQFLAGNKVMVDSAEVNNQVVPHDSVKVAFSALDPASSHLLLP